MYAELQLISLIFVVNLVYQIKAQMHTTEIREKLKEFNQQTEVETNIFIYNSRDVDISEYITKETTVILVNHMQNNFKLIYQLNKNALAIVIITERNNSKVLDILNEVLTRLRHLKVLFILPTTTIDEERQLGLFWWAWRSGYTHIMSLHATTSINGTQITLMSYRPFPELHLVRVEHPVDYFRCTLPHDFQGHPIRTPLGESAPIIFSYKDRYGHRKTSGIMYYEFLHFMQVHNATLEEVVLPKPYPGIVQMESVTTAVQRNQIDISLHFYFVDYDKWHVTQPPITSQFYFRVPNAKPRSLKDYVWAPFECKLWNAILQYLLFLALILTIINFVSTRIERLRQAPKRLHIGRVSSMITSVASQRSQRTELNRASSSHNYYTQLRLVVFENAQIFIDTILKLLPSLNFTANRRGQCTSYKLRLSFIYIFHCLLAFILVNYYSALIVSFLTTGIYEPQLNSIADVINSPFKILLSHTDILYFITDAELRRKVVIVNWSELWQKHKSLNDSVILLSTQWGYDFFSSQQINLHHKRVRLLDSEVIWNAMCGMIMPLDSPYVEMLTDMLLWSFNTGLYAKAYHDTRRDAFDAGILQKLPGDYEAGFALNVHYFYWAWWLCIVGYMLSAGVFLIERFWHKRTN
ncbi:uncharacterized protein [Bactrocera oleae]|uniref:uncharacterized protein n=1 Tax=Bactrocera oleae TaxID=104688 RepID=UPI00387EAAB5